MHKLPFSELGLSEPTLKAVEKLGFEQTSPIQSASIPVLMSGRDVVGQSATGSGKTAAFAIPAIELVKDTDRKPQILVLVPTRELATQVAEEFSRLSAYRPKVHAVPIYGGASYDRQFAELRKGPQIVIGTPGRVIDHLQRNTLDLSEVKMAVLDECDRMLDMGFREDMERILAAAPKERQTVFFSATLPPPIRRLIEQFGRQPEHIKIEAQALTVPTVEQIFFDVPPRAKLDALCRLLDIHDARLSLVFANTQRTVDEIADALLARGYAADRLHGGISQALRTRTMSKFKRSEFEILVATDVAGRGLDVDDLDLVINYDLPYDPEDYVHRIGRTGRAGRNGVAMTLVSGREVYRLQHVERFTRQRIRRGRVPTWDQVEEKRLSQVLDQVRATLDGGKHQSCAIYIDRLLDEGHAATDLAAALLQQLLSAEGIDKGEQPAADPFAPRVPAAGTPAVTTPESTSKAAAKSKKPPKVEPDAVPAPSSASPPPAAAAPADSPAEPQEPADVPAPLPAPEPAAPPTAAILPVEPGPEAVSEPATAPATAIAVSAEEVESPIESEQPVKSEKPAKPAEPVESRPRISRPEPGAGTRKPARTTELPPPSPGYRWITLNAGKEDGLSPRDIVDAITEGGEFDGKAVGLIKLEAGESHVQIKAGVAAAVVEALTGAVVGEKTLEVFFAKAGAPPRSRKAPSEDAPHYKRPRHEGERSGGGFQKPGGYYKKPGGFRKEGFSSGRKPGGFRNFGETRSGETRTWRKEDDRPAGGEGRSFSRERTAPDYNRPRPPRKNFGGPKKGPGRW